MILAFLYYLWFWPPVIPRSSFRSRSRKRPTVSDLHFELVRHIEAYPSELLIAGYRCFYHICNLSSESV